MVGVVGSSPIVPTKFNTSTLHVDREPGLVSRLIAEFPETDSR